MCLVTNETKLDARKIVSIYERCWNIEVFFKELRGELVLGEYQVMSEEANHHIQTTLQTPLD